MCIPWPGLIDAWWLAWAVREPPLQGGRIDLPIRDSGDDLDASSWLAGYLQGSTLSRCALAHGFQAEVAGEVVLRFEAGAVVGDLEGDVVGVFSQGYPGVGCTGVFDGV